MPITVTCQCGKTYNLKDEFAGQVLQCANCGKSLEVGAGLVSNDFKQGLGLDAGFKRDKFLLRQKLLAISEKYDVCDEQGKPIFYVERPAHLLRNLTAVFAGVIAGIAFMILMFMLGEAVPDPLKGWFFTIGLVGWLVVTFVVVIWLYKKRHVTIYRDKTKQEPLIKILQNKKAEIITATFTVRDANDGEIAFFRKNYLYDIFRKHWHCYAPDGSLICVAKEDSVILALLRRFLGTFFGLLRTNFIIVRGKSDQVIGEFNRNFTILDRYVLDMSADPTYYLDRKIAIALGIMLDTGERR